MIEKITTDRIEVERMAMDTYIYQKSHFGWIEYADILALNRLGTYKLAITLEYVMTPDWTKLLIQEIKSLNIPIEKLKGCIMFFTIDKLGESYLNIKSLYDCINFMHEYTKNESNGELEKYINILWTTRTDPGLPTNTLQANLIFTVEKTEEDKREDEAHRQLMEDYAKSRYE